jgi:hypothetical protein
MRNDEVKGSADIQKNTSSGLQIITLNRGAFQEYFMTSVPEGNEPAQSLFQRMADAVRARKAHIISQEVFGIPDREGTGMQMLKDTMGGIVAPVTWLEDGHVSDLCGAHLRAVSGTSVNRLELDGRIVGSVIEDDYARYCYLGGLLPRRDHLSPSEQASVIFDQMEETLEAAGMEFSHVLRTWFYNNNILDW